MNAKKLFMVFVESYLVVVTLIMFLLSFTVFVVALFIASYNTPKDVSILNHPASIYVDAGYAGIIISVIFLMFCDKISDMLK